MEVWPTPRSGDVYFVVAHLILCYLAPLAVISVCYTLVWCHVCQRRVPGETQGRKVKRMMHRTRAKAIQVNDQNDYSNNINNCYLFIMFL
jgi:Tfp pilus assembly protein PilO